MGISNIFELGKQGLAANRQALQTTSNNIANANSPDYSRQRPVFQTNESTMTDGLLIGGGVSVPKVIRVHDEFIQRQLVEESKNLGGAKVRMEGMRHVEQILHRDGFQMGELTNNFFNAYRELSANPENPAIRNQVKNTAEALTTGFRSLTDSLEDAKRDIDVKLSANVEEVNALAKELAGLNDKIVQWEARDVSPNELLDRRDAVVKNLSTKLGYPVNTSQGGFVNFSASGLGALVEGATANELVVMRTPASGDKGAGSLEVFVKDNWGLHNVTKTLQEGEFAGMLHVRDQVINKLQDRLDHTAFGIANEVNQLHKTGSGLDGQSERALFSNFEEIKGAASTFSLSDDVKKSFEAIAAAELGAGPGDNRLALAITALQDKAVFPTDGFFAEGKDARYTVNESLNNLMGGLATETANEEQVLKHQESIVGQLENYKQSISGVSLEEEAINMIQYQSVFNAAAKTLKIGDELLDTILSLKD